MTVSALNKALLGKIETTPGTDAAPVVGTDAIRIITATPNLDISPLEYDAIKQTYGKLIGPLDERAMTLDVEFYIRSGGALGTIPDYAPILHAAANTITSTANTSVAINPITAIGAARHTATFHYYEDGLLYKFVGAVCSACSIDFPLDNLIRGKATIIAPYLQPTAVAFPAGLVFQSSDPIHPRPADVITDAGTAIKVGTFSFDTGIAGAVRRLIGGAEANVTGRDRSKIAISKDSLGTIGDINRLTNVTAGAFSAVMGTAGNRISLTSAKAYYGTFKSEAQDALMMRTIDLLLAETNGDDAYQILID